MNSLLLFVADLLILAIASPRTKLPNSGKKRPSSRMARVQNFCLARGHPDPFLSGRMTLRGVSYRNLFSRTGEGG